MQTQMKTPTPARGALFAALLTLPVLLSSCLVIKREVAPTQTTTVERTTYPNGTTTTVTRD